MKTERACIQSGISAKLMPHSKHYHRMRNSHHNDTISTKISRDFKSPNNCSRYVLTMTMRNLKEPIEAYHGWPKLQIIIEKMDKDRVDLRLLDNFFERSSKNIERNSLNGPKRIIKYNLFQIRTYA